MSLRILLVDDDLMTLATLRRTLAGAGHETCELNGGFGFTVALRNFDPDVVLLDVNMPGLGGLGALRSARELQRVGDGRPRVVLYSGCDPDELRRTAEVINADGYLHKPATSEAILAVVHAA